MTFPFISSPLNVTVMVTSPPSKVKGFSCLVDVLRSSDTSEARELLGSVVGDASAILPFAKALQCFGRVCKATAVVSSGCGFLILCERRRRRRYGRFWPKEVAISLR